MTVPTAAPDADPTAVVGRRFGAAAIDLGILWVFSATFWFLASERVPEEISAILGRGSGFDPCTGRGVACTSLNDRYVSGGPMVVLVLVWMTYLVGVFVVQRGLTGRTVGTMLTGVAVVGADGRPLGPGGALIRSVAGVVDYLPCCLPLVGFVTVLATPGHRRVGDMAAESYVVGNDDVGRPVQLPGPPVPPEPVRPMSAAYPSQPPVASAPRPPEAPAVPVAPTAPDATVRPGDQGPVWDPERRAYLQWDSLRQQWLQFDQATGRWQQYDAATARWRPVEG